MKNPFTALPQLNRPARFEQTSTDCRHGNPNGNRGPGRHSPKMVGPLPKPRKTSRVKGILPSGMVLDGMRRTALDRPPQLKRPLERGALMFR